LQKGIALMIAHKKKSQEQVKPAVLIDEELGDKLKLLWETKAFQRAYEEHKNDSFLQASKLFCKLINHIELTASSTQSSASPGMTTCRT